MGFSQYLLDSHEQYRQQVRLHNGWVIRLRWWYLLILGAVALLTSYTSKLESGDYRIFVAALIAGGLGVNFILWLATKPMGLRVSTYHFVAGIQALLDTSLAASVVYFQGGIDSRATVLFAVPILMKGILFPPLFAYLAATLSSIMYSGALILYVQLQHPSYGMREVVLPAVFYSFVFFMLAIIVSQNTARNSAKARENSYAELLSLLRHQLHHPSGVIAAIVEMLEFSEGYSKLSPKDKEYIRQLKYENHRINSMISNVLQVAQIKGEEEKTSEKWTDVNLMVLISTCATSTATAYKRVGDLELNIPHDDAIVHGQHDKLQLAFENIIENAFKFSNAGSKVTVSLFTKKMPTIEIDIQDHGVGLSSKDQKKLFKAFTNIENVSTDNAGNIKTYSMGLGLYISKIIIEQHGGKLELQSTEGKGTKVIVRLKRDMWRYYYGQK